jgi:hypothetical protein
MPFPWRVRALTGFAERAQKGTFGKGRQVQACTVSGYVSSVGQTIALAIGANPVKTKNGDKYLMRLQQTLDGWRHAHPPTEKKLPVESDVPEYLVNKAGHKAPTALGQAIDDLTTIVFYYLLRVGEYTVKRNRNETKHMVQFKMEDVTFKKKDNNERLRCLPQNAKLADIMSADGTTLKLDNQKNSWKRGMYLPTNYGQPISLPCTCFRTSVCTFA